MPWKAAGATKHQKAASDASLRRLWASVANNVLKTTGDEGIANQHRQCPRQCRDHEADNKGKD